MHRLAENVLASHLDPGERLLWSGQPRAGIRLRAVDTLLIPFTLLWGGFAFFWEYMVLTHMSNAPQPMVTIFPLFGLPFVFVGLYMIFGRFIVDAMRRGRTYYGVTNERIIVISGLFAPQIKSLMLKTLDAISFAPRMDGSGTITFGQSNFVNAVFPAGSWPGAGRFASPAFELIDRAKEVYDLVREAQRAATGSK